MKTGLAKILSFLSTSLVLACLLCCWVISFFGSIVIKDLFRSGCGQNFADFYLPPPPLPTSLPLSVFFSPTLPTILSLTQVTVIWNQCAPKPGFDALQQFKFRYWSPWEKVSRRASCKALRWDKGITIRSLHRPISYYILASFKNLRKWINHPDPGGDKKGTKLFAFLRWPLGLWSREQALRSEMN